MATEIPDALVLRLLDHEKQPEHPIDCLEFSAAVSIGWFRGRTTFSVYKRDFDRFLDGCDALIGDFAGEAQLRCGWGEDIYFDMKAFYFDRRGHIAVELELADGGSRKRMHRLLVDFETEPALLERFVVEGRQVLQGGQKTTIRFAGIGPEPN